MFQRFPNRLQNPPFSLTMVHWLVWFRSTLEKMGRCPHSKGPRLGYPPFLDDEPQKVSTSMGGTTHVQQHGEFQIGASTKHGCIGKVMEYVLSSFLGDQSSHGWSIHFHRDLDPPWHGIPMTWDDALVTMHPLTTHRTQWSNDMVKIFQCQLGVRSTTSPFVSWISTGHHSCSKFHSRAPCLKHFAYIFFVIL